MIQTTGDSGAGAQLGNFVSRVNGIGPILTYTLGDPRNPLTFIGKYYQECDAENTFEGHLRHRRHRQILTSNVRFGSFADMRVANVDVRFVP